MQPRLSAAFFDEDCLEQLFQQGEYGFHPICLSAEIDMPEGFSLDKFFKKPVF